MSGFKNEQLYTYVVFFFSLFCCIIIIAQKKSHLQVLKTGKTVINRINTALSTNVSTNNFKLQKC